MKKPAFKKISAFILVLAQLFTLFIATSFSANAADRRTYTAFKTEKEVVLDGIAGENEDWDSVPWSENFEKYTGTTLEHNFAGRFKVMWQTDDNGAYLYFFIEITDNDVYSNWQWYEDCIIVAVDETNSATKFSQDKDSPARNSKSRGAVAKKDGDAPSKVFDWLYTFVRYTETGYVFEIKYFLYDAQNAKDGTEFAFDVWAVDTVNPRVANKFSSQIAWASKTSADNNMNLSVNGGSLILKDANSNADVLLTYQNNTVGSLTKDEENNVVLPEKSFDGTVFAGWLDASANKLYPAGATLAVGSDQLTLEAVTVNFTMQTGAAARLDSKGISTSGIKYENRIATEDYQKISSFVNSTGTLILPTDYLASENVKFTAKSLTNNNILYNDVVNNGWYNEETASTDGYFMYFGSIVDILKTNYTRNFSGIGYIEINYSDGTTGRIYTDYSVENHSRNISYIIDAALSDTESYTEEEISVLNAMKANGVN